MAIAIPPAVNYPAPLVALPSLSQQRRDPPEGRLQFSGEILWASMGGANNCIAFDASRVVSRVGTLKVDNSHCTVDVMFVFPDTSETVVVPGLTPYALVPILSNKQQFYAIALGTPSVADVTRFIGLNYRHMSALVQQGRTNTRFENFSIQWPNAFTTTQLYAAGSYGLLLYMTMFMTNTQDGASQFAIGSLRLYDGNGNNILPDFKVFAQTAGIGFVFTNARADLGKYNRIPFRNGLLMDFTPISGWAGVIRNVDGFLTALIIQG